MVIARHARGVSRDADPMLFGHCLGATTTPRITVTAFEMAEEMDNAGRAPAPASEPHGRASIGWSIGGEIAESGVDRTPEEQVRVARAELAACLPWLDTSKLELATIRWNRAEGLTADGSRPDEPVLRRFVAQSVIVGWPTKLAFAPEFARRVSEELGSMNIAPRGVCEVAGCEVEPPLTPPLWKLEGLRWT
jgi:hypothetical protein